MVSSSPQSTIDALAKEFGAIEGAVAFRGKPLATYTSMGVGGPADWILEVGARGALAQALRILDEAKIERLVLGGGSNTLFEDAGFRGAVIVLEGEFRAIGPGESEDALRAGAGAILGHVMNFAKRNSLGGMEFCAGIPGTLGGALAGNAGAAGEDICSVTESVEVLDPSGEVRTLKQGEFAYRYRKSELKDRVILGATLKLTKEDPKRIKEKIDAHIAHRIASQPYGEQSAGCMFKNPEGNYAGKLIEEAGLKGLRIGGIQVSDLHGNFMVNAGAGTTEDIAKLIDYVRGEVRRRSGIELEREVCVIPAAGMGKS